MSPVPRSTATASPATLSKSRRPPMRSERCRPTRPSAKLHGRDEKYPGGPYPSAEGGAERARMRGGSRPAGRLSWSDLVAQQ
jgi:hypothetical protein